MNFLLALIISFTKPNSDSLQKKYTYSYQICNFISVKYYDAELEFLDGNKFSFYYSISGMQSSPNPRLYTGSFEVRNSIVFLKPAAEYENLPKEISYKITEEGLVKQSTQEERLFPLTLKKEKPNSPVMDTIKIISPNREYYYSNESPWVGGVINSYWSLSLKPDKTFSLYFNRLSVSTSSELETSYKPKYAWGIWEEKGDTLILKHFFLIKDMNRLESSEEKYLITTFGYEICQSKWYKFPPKLLRKE